jgi:ATP-dependent Clp protease ATP-binding subunit ClpC
MDDNFSPRVKDVITYSKEEALRLGHDFYRRHDARDT